MKVVLLLAALVAVAFATSCTVQGVGSGNCQDVNVYHCNGDYYTGRCPGPNNIQCCVASQSSSGYKANQATVNLVKGFEGWRSCYYLDAAGLGTIGYGHLVKSGEPYKSGTCISQADGETLLRRDMQTAVNCVNQALQVSLDCNQFGALVSWTFNVGCGAMSGSTLMRKLNAGDYNSVCTELMKWNKAGGKVISGLTTRRQAECSLFENGGGSGC